MRAGKKKKKACKSINPGIFNACFIEGLGCVSIGLVFILHTTCGIFLIDTQQDVVLKHLSPHDPAVVSGLDSF